MQSCRKNKLCFYFRNIGSHLVINRSVDACSGKPNFVSSLEHVQAQLTLSYNRRGNLAIYLISPQGTRSTLLTPRSGAVNLFFCLSCVKCVWFLGMMFFFPSSWQTHCCMDCTLVVSLAPIKGYHFLSLSFRPHDYSSEGFNDWAFMTTHSWDEDPRGEWTLEIENVAGTSDYGNY